MFGVSDAAGKDATLKVTMPVDLAGCHALIEQLTCTVQSQMGTIEQLRREKQEIELALAELLQRAFRNRSERYLNNPNQLRLDFKDSDAAADAAEGLAQAVEEAGLPVQAHVRRRHGRKPRSEALAGPLGRGRAHGLFAGQTRSGAASGATRLVEQGSAEADR